MDTPEVDEQISKELRLITTCEVIAIAPAALSGISLCVADRKVSGSGLAAEKKRKAAVTIIILSTIFVDKNTVYLAGGLWMINGEGQDDNEGHSEGEDYSDVEGGEPAIWEERLWEAVMKYALPLNSVLDPIVYLVRQESLRECVVCLWKNLRRNNDEVNFIISSSERTNKPVYLNNFYQNKKGGNWGNMRTVADRH